MSRPVVVSLNMTPAPCSPRHVNSLCDLVRRATDVRREDQSQVAAFWTASFNRGNRLPSPFPDRRIVKIGVQVLVLFHKEEQRTPSRLLN